MRVRVIIAACLAVVLAVLAPLPVAADQCRPEDIICLGDCRFVYDNAISFATADLIGCDDSWGGYHQECHTQYNMRVNSALAEFINCNGGVPF